MKQLFLCIFTLLFLGVSHQILAALDTSFGTSGVVITSVGLSDQATAVSLQSTDTFILIAGSTTINAVETIVTARYTSTGTLDSTYGTDGIQTTTIGTEAAASSMAIQSDNKIIIGGFAFENQTKFALARYNTDGTLDDTFNGSGIKTSAIRQGASIETTTLTSSGNIIVGGASVAGESHFTLANYTSSGSLNAGFGTGGIVIQTIGFSSVVKALAIQSDGKIIAAGYCNPGDTNQFILGRYNSDGTLDSTFGVGGLVTTLIGTECYANSVTIQSDGKIVAAGTTRESNTRKFAVARYTSDGVLDSSFNGTGVITTEIQNSGRAKAVGLQSDGKVVVAGLTRGANNPQGGNTNQFAVARYTIGGTLDTTFGINGLEITIIGTIAEANALVIQPDDKIVVAGSSDGNFALARYEAQVT